ncbi:hypothetical protein Zmor_001586 [Zophobas morio]|uniref:Transposase n=1 Tax=Zophobas morio TaxID=2755281 RepID=A0AA38J7Q2_9CUCU|nr:hypothetical protein Zmor_001586 [Zophobas morio]
MCPRSTLQHLREYGSFKLAAQDRGRLRSVELLILKRLFWRVSKLDRALARITVQCDVSESSIWRILREQLHPFHDQKVQLLKPTDLPRRQNFCEWVNRKINEQANFVSRIPSTDEAGYTREGVINTHIWANEIPYAIREQHFQYVSKCLSC